MLKTDAAKVLGPCAADPDLVEAEQPVREHDRVARRPAARAERPARAASPDPEHQDDGEDRYPDPGGDPGPGVGWDCVRDPGQVRVWRSAQARPG